MTIEKFIDGRNKDEVRIRRFEKRKYLWKQRQKFEYADLKASYRSKAREKFEYAELKT